MNKNQIDELLAEQKKRRQGIILRCLICVLVFGVSGFLLFNYVNSTKDVYVNYTEDAEIEYSVNLDENEYLETTQENGKQYIAKLINNIDANFKYNVGFSMSDINYSYTYEIVANYIVKDKTNGKALLDKEEILVERQPVKNENKTKLEVEQEVSIDYQKYNEPITEFINTYGLNNAEAELNVKMLVWLEGAYSKNNDFSNEKQEILLSVPLNSNTVSITLDDNLVNAEKTILVSKDNSLVSTLLLISGIGTMLVLMVLIIQTVKYIIKSRSAEDIYMRELKHILNNYGSYIQEVKNFSLRGYRVVLIKTFTDMLEIHDTIKQPILMSENRARRQAYFAIPTTDRVAYVYRIDINEIRVELSRDAK